MRFLRRVFFLVSIFLVVSTSPAHALDQTSQSTDQLNERLQQALTLLVGDDSSAFLGFRPQISLIKSSVPNAYATPNRQIVVSSGLLALAETPEELAFALAHELGHLCLHHLSSTRALAAGQLATQLRVDEEVEADRFAAGLLAKIGLDQSAGLSLLKKLSNFGVDHGTRWADLYPSLGRRVSAFQDGLSAAHKQGL